MTGVWALIGSRWGLFIAGQLTMLVAAASGLAFPWTVRHLFAHVLDSRSPAGLGLSVALLGAVLLVRDVAEYLKRRSLGQVSAGVVHTLREQVYDALLTRSLSFFRSKSAGELASAASNDITAVQSGLTVVLTNLIQQGVVLATVVTMLFRLDSMLAAVVCLFIPPLLLVGRRMARRAARTTEHRQRVLGEIMTIVQQSIAGIEVIRSYLLEGVAHELHRTTNDRSLAVSVKTVEIGAASALWSGLLADLFLLSVMGFGGYRVVTGHMTAPDLIAFILYSEMITGPFTRLASLVPEIAKTGTAFSRIRGLLEDGYPDPAGTKPSDGGSVPTGDIEFQSVTFAYHEGTDVLRDIEFSIPAGSTAALVGPSGAGKSTILRLLPRLYEPSSGCIAIGGVDVADVGADRLRASIGMVSQDPFIFDLSIADNIRCGRPDASDDEVRRAAIRAYADGFIRRLPDGYATNVGDGGSRLSGGQRQRIAVARAFLKDPRVLLLDEATAALDRRSEASVLAALDELKSGRTTLVIAHRLETVRYADLILLLDEGRIVDRGTHDELLLRSSLYGELYGSAVPRGDRDLTQSTVRAASRRGTGSARCETDSSDPILWRS